MKHNGKNPWLWIPSLYVTEALPYVTVMTLSVMMYKRMNISNTDIALYTSWLYLPWVIKPFWSPFVDLVKTKRWWIVCMQLLIGAGLAGIAFTIPTSHFFQTTLAFFWLVAFSSATHDIAADGFYMLELDEHQQAFYVGIRSTFYRVGTIAGQGLLIMLAGTLEVLTRKISYSWSITFYVLAGFILAACLYHQLLLPHPRKDHATAHGRMQDLPLKFLKTFTSFFRKPGVTNGILFLLLYRLPEALLVKVCNLFLIDPVQTGGLGLSTQEVGLVQGTVGVMGLTLGGIIGGMAIAKDGLKKWLWPMVWSLTLPNAVYIYLSFFPTKSLWLISSMIFTEQFGYGFGFTAYMLYMIYFSRGEQQTAHYAICTAFMALSMMLPGMMAGWLQEQLGYQGFFLFVMISSLTTILVSRKIRLNATFGKK